MSLMSAYGRGATAFALKNGLKDPSPLVRIGALRGSQRWEPQRRWQEAQHLLDDAYLAVRIEAARVLSLASGTLPAAAQIRLTAGITEYLATQSLHADRAEAQTNMATVLAATGESERAESALLEALHLNPQWIPALANLADLYRATGRDEAGGPLLDRGIEAAPDSPSILLAKALWLVRQQRTESALPLLAKAAELAPGNTRFAYIHGVALHSSGQSEQALSVLDNALLLRPADRQLLEAAASIARETGDTNRMQGYLERLQ
jgi:tetratricopeptide (TPR) repeat protein